MNKQQEQLLREAEELIEAAWDVINKAMAQKAKDYEQEQIADAQALAF